MGSNSIPQKTPSDESINRGLVCAHMQFIARTQKILSPRRANADNKRRKEEDRPKYFPEDAYTGHATHGGSHRLEVAVPVGWALNTKDQLTG